MGIPARDSCHNCFFKSQIYSEAKPGEELSSFCFFYKVDISWQEKQNSKLVPKFWIHGPHNSVHFIGPMINICFNRSVLTLKALQGKLMKPNTESNFTLSCLKVDWHSFFNEYSYSVCCCINIFKISYIFK